MNATLLIICHSQHQLEKGLYLKKILPNHVDIKCVNFIPLSIQSKKSFSIVKSSKELIDDSNYYDKFIFFSITPSKVLFEIIKAIRKSKKQIIVIQETHQLSMSNGTINSIMMSPDLVIAASDAEKDLMIQNKLFKKNTINSAGWIFQKKFHEFIHTEVTINEGNNFNNYVLVIFSAPQMITSSSSETYQKRREILEWVQKNNPNTKVLIKLHPLEDRQKFINFNNIQNNALIDFAPSHSNIYSLSLHAKNIVLSDQTQAFIDLIDINKKLIVYNLKGENFIFSFLNKTIKTKNYKEITFFEIADSSEVLKEFRSIYLKSENGCLKSFVKTINNSDIQINPIAHTEIALREFVLGNSKTLHHVEFNNAEKLKNFIENNNAFHLKEIENDIETTSLKTSITIYVMNKIINGEISNESQINYFLHNFINPYFVQYFFLETLRFKFFLNHIRLEMDIDKDSLAIINNSQKMAQKKSFLMNLLMMLEAKICVNKINLIRTPIYILLNLCLLAVVRFKR
jgi:hypothetical protein